MSVTEPRPQHDVVTYDTYSLRVWHISDDGRLANAVNQFIGLTADEFGAYRDLAVHPSEPLLAILSAGACEPEFWRIDDNALQRLACVPMSRMADSLSFTDRDDVLLFSIVNSDVLIARMLEAIE
jgi:hypothetical protein